MFISQLDPFGEQNTSYRVRRALEKSNTTVYNGLHEIYVNTAVNDGTLIAELMQYFENSNGINPNFEKLSTRVEELKTDETEVTSMANVFDEYAQEVAEKVSQERLAKQAKEAAVYLLKEGVPVEIIAKAHPTLSIDDIKQLEQQELANA